MFLGRNGFKWFEGVVEDRDDPMQMGRVRVRVYGMHTDQKVKSELEGIPTEELLWMTVATDTTSGRISGIGNSPTGILPGTEVMGYFRDQYCQVGVVLATIGGIEHKTDSDKGFSDPLGQFPRDGYIGQQDVNKLARSISLNDAFEPVQTGDVGKNTTANRMQDENTSTAVNPDDTSSDSYIPDDDPNFTIQKMLMQDEGIKNVVYWDTEGYPTIGIGHLVVYKKTRNTAEIYPILDKKFNRTTNGRITEQEITQLFQEDLQEVQREIVRNKKTGPVYIKMNRSRQMAMENMSFQLNVNGLAKFGKALDHMLAERWADARRELLDSVWAKSQTPGRANRVSKIVLTGNLESYGVMTPKEEPKQARMMNFAVAANEETEDDYDPSAPFTPKDTRVMFDEPETSYNAVYPYNHVYESESGHIQEFDDTPGNERYRRIHPAGTYEEISPSGRRVTKIVGEDFLIVQEGQNVNIKGNLKVVIEADANVYYMGNVTQTVDGNVTEFVRGNVKQTVEGELFSQVKQNAQVIVNKNADITVDENLTVNVKQDATVNVTEKATVNAKNADINISETLNANAKDMNFDAENISMHGSSLVEITGGNVRVG